MRWQPQANLFLSLPTDRHRVETSLMIVYSMPSR